MSKKISIALDGPSGAGKSSQAKHIAETFNFIYVDTGAIYRTVGLACRMQGIDCKDAQAVKKLLPELTIEIKYDGEKVQRMFLNGEDVSGAIRMPEISIAASDVSALPECRSFLLEMQRKFARESNVVMDGRDIGTVVLPDADLKIYLTASSEARARRRVLELREKGVDQPFEEVLKDIEYRDYQDIHRQTAPLKQAEDAVPVDCSETDFAETFELLCKIIEERLGIAPCKEDE